MKQIFGRLILLTLVVALAGCNQLIFHPDKDHYPIPDGLGISRQSYFFRNADNLLLHGWFIPAVTDVTHGTILFLHGNAQNISTHLRAVWWLPHAGYNVFMFDYRGYGRSQGEASLAGLHQDVQAAMDHLFTQLPVNKNNVFIYGQSLGGALAITASPRSKHFAKIRGVIVQGAFTSYRRVAQEALDNWWLSWALQWPLSHLITDEYRPIDAIAAISPKPILIIQGTEDQVIKPHHGQDLFTAAKQPKQYWLIEKAGHNNVLANKQVRKQLLDYLQQQLQTATPNTD